MNLHVVGCSHRSAPIEVRERLAFSNEQARSALDNLQRQFPKVEAVLLSTCNRVELYVASENGHSPTREQLSDFLVRCHDLNPAEVLRHLWEEAGREAVRHLFLVASSLDSMVLGEPQILCQVKEAYQRATEQAATGPLTHAVFQAAMKTARRIATETAIHQHRVSIPSVAVADFAQQIFERFDDKRTLVIGAGEMAEETLKYLKHQGAGDLAVVNRSPQRAVELASRYHGEVVPWQYLIDALITADLVISTTGAPRPIVTLEDFRRIEPLRDARPLFVLDLAVPRDFDAAIGNRPGVYLYAIDDLRQMCEQNRAQRDRELPTALRIVDQETDRFLTDLRHRAVGPVIQRLRQGWQKPKEDELQRLLNKLPALDDPARNEIRQSFDRLVNKLLHPPLECLRNEARYGTARTLLDALAKLFQLQN